jgi:predicted SAM-dependent methyltransferase
MPFLFVDYDQGAGGEFFCAQLSRSDQCVTLDYVKYPNNRTKVFDRFHQEFLKLDPAVDSISTDDKLYELVPTHRHTALAKSILPNLKSIRISQPEIDDPLWYYYKQQQISKVLLTNEPTDQQTVGLLRMLVNSTGSKEFLKKIKTGMDTLSLILLADGIDPTAENKDNYINSLLANRTLEPEVSYDLIIPYRDLFFNARQIEKNLQDIFNIVVKDSWLDTYKNNYETYLSQT